MECKIESDKLYNKGSVKLPTSDVLYELKDRALASAAEGITISDPAQPDNPLIYVNSGFTAITGYSSEEVLGRSCRFLQGPDTGPEAAQAIRQALAEDRPCVVELLNYRKDGSTFWNRLSITPIRNTAGKTTHYIGVLSDITRRKEAEDALRKTNERLEAANATMKRALKYAADIQQSLLPAPVLRGDNCKIISTLKPCDELAGDTLNYFMLNDHLFGFYVLDVIGHGVSAALLSVTVSHLLSPRSGKSCLFESMGPQQKAGQILSPAQVGSVLNGIFADDANQGQFFTIFYGIWDSVRRELTYFSAGHPAGIYVPMSGATGRLHASSYPVGVHAEPDYRNYTLRLEKGDRLFVYTDGLTEAMNEHQEEFGADRLNALVERLRDKPLEVCMEAIIFEAEQFGRGAPFRDDLSLVGFEVTA